MKINEVTEADYETSPEQKQLANVGRALMNHANSAQLKGKSDDEVMMYNKVSTLGDALTRFGADWGPKNLKDLEKITGLNAKQINAYFDIGKKLHAAKKAPAPVAQDDDNEFNDGPSDDEIARQADARASKRRK
jgi:hypothetical protein|tara:strand:+ start:222 stop:623 length:402 start_codon:yes stop_codon:yes gene_type:complete